MQSQEIRTRFLEFFKRRGHTILPGASLVPENDPSVLFTTAGMQPLVPYLLGEPHPAGQRLANIQKCVRTQDIDEVGDKTHDTFFEMLGNWSLGDPTTPDGVGRAGYFKEEAIQWSYEFLTSKKEGLGLDPARLYVTLFEGDDPSTPESLRTGAPRDTEAFEIWKKYLPENRIYFLPADKNWWSPGENGPCGPDTEMFYDVTARGLGDMTKEEYIRADREQKVVEVWNDVFMEYEKKDGQVIGKLKQKNVDTGAGLERLAMVVQGKDTIFETDVFQLIVERIKNQESRIKHDATALRAERIIADHIRTSVFLITDGVRPSNTDRGYIVRRLLRRAVRFADTLGCPPGTLSQLVDPVVRTYADIYAALRSEEKNIVEEIQKEEQKFRQTLERGLREFDKNLKGSAVGSHLDHQLTSVALWNLFQSYGFPLEVSLEIAKEKNIKLAKDAESLFHTLQESHKELSRQGSEQKFKGGLADHSAKVTAFHTATHLMLAGLRKELGDGIHQAGSNITLERTRFDFTHPEKVSRDVLDRVEAYVNTALDTGAIVTTKSMDKEAARAAGVEGSFWEKYPDKVTVYQVEGPDGVIYSRELCGGPHVANTRDIATFGHFKITKEEACSAGVRRIKAVLE